ncbi:hypothetical protein C8J57DRAFT_1254077 [Mycena rebaudengoi]|nr:hypothetical protein C8J57DRAFT_1254077 [Mycena rebaudengoi]
MALCPSFFTDPETPPSLQDKSFDDAENGWCKPPYKLGNFMTGGYTIIHEMTHLSMIGVAAELGPASSQEEEEEAEILPVDENDNPCMVGVDGTTAEEEEEEEGNPNDEDKDNSSQEGTTDVMGKLDENDKKNMEPYAGGPRRYAPIAAMVLRQRWMAFLGQPGGREDTKLKEPKVGSTENAESYAAVATGEKYHFIRF